MSGPEPRAGGPPEWVRESWAKAAAGGPVADDRAHCRTCSCGTEDYGVKDGEATSATEVSLPWKLMADLLDSRERAQNQVFLARSSIGDAL